METPLKRCTKCGIEQPATLEYFREKNGKLSNPCRACCRTQVNFNARKHGTKEREITRKGGMKRCWNCKRWLPETTEYFVRSKRETGGYDCQCKDCSKKSREDNHERYSSRQAAYRADPAHREKARLTTKAWRDADPKRAVRASARYDKAHPEVHKRAMAKWGKKNPAKLRAGRLRRRARERSLPATFTEADWLRCLEYHNYSCAVCGAQLQDLFGNIAPHADHWMPISWDDPRNPGTVPANIVCLCNACNKTKTYKLPEEWLVEQFGKRKAQAILKRINAYFAALLLD